METAMLIHLVYPTVHTALPIIPDLKKSPRFYVLDTGMLNYFAGLQKSVLGATDLQVVYKGMIAEHIVGQEILASHVEVLRGLNFWVRDKASSAAEIDYVVQFEDMLVPVEVKSTAAGALRSLHLFMDNVNHHYAVRCYPGQLRVDTVQTPGGKEFLLLNLPYYLTFKIDEYLTWFVHSYSTTM
jgi:predicted AAA+ superfamily ATPase